MIGLGISPYFKSNFGSGFVPPPPPPYVVGSVLIIKLQDQVAGVGPSIPSNGFSVGALGLDGGTGSGNITMTFPSHFEGSSNGGATWSTSPVLIPYIAGAVTTASIYKVRTAGGQPIGNYSGTIMFTVDDPMATIRNIDVMGNIIQGNYNSITVAFINAVTAAGGSLLGYEKDAINNATTQYPNIVSEADRLFIHGLQSRIAAKINLVDPNTTVPTEVNSPTFIPGLGFKSDNVTSYININFNLSTDSVKFTQDSCCIAALSVVKSVTNDNTMLGALQLSGPIDRRTRLMPSIGGDYIYTLNTDADKNTPTVPAYDDLGLFHARRTANNFSDLHVRGTFIDSNTSISTGLPNLSCFLLALNFNGSVDTLSGETIAFSLLGSGNIDPIELNAFTQILFTALSWGN